ncbi:FxsA cytoplasmic membrane protein, partial [Candidatus Haloredivivus sp. G17]
MLRFLIVLLLVVPFIDLYLLIEVSGLMGFWTVIALVLLTGMIGAELIRREGRHVLLKLQRSVTSGEVSRNVAEGAI